MDDLQKKTLLNLKEGTSNRVEERCLNDFWGLALPLAQHFASFFDWMLF
jgi:hypothetical protein